MHEVHRDNCRLVRVRKPSIRFSKLGAIVRATGNNLQGANSLGIAARTVSGPEQIGVLSVPEFSGRQTHPHYSFLASPIGLPSGLTGSLVGYQSTVGPTCTVGLLMGGPVRGSRRKGWGD